MGTDEHTIDFENQESVFLQPGEVYLLQAGRVHQARPRGRLVNLSFAASNSFVRPFNDADELVRQ